MSSTATAELRLTPEIAKDAFARAMALLEQQSTDYVLRWVKQVRCAGVSADGKVQLAVADKFSRDFIQEHFSDLLASGLSAQLGERPALEWTIDEALKAQSPVEPPPPAPAPTVKVQPADRPRLLDERYTFETFVAAPSNQLANAGALAVSQNPGIAFNPLFIYGGTGLGKTHLLHAIGNALLKQDANKRIVYLSSEEFTNEFIVSVRDGRMPEFRRKYRDECDCLLIDDIQFLGTREQTQEEFFHTFNALQSARKPVAITSDTVPSEIPGLAERLRSRFSSGLIADIQEPDFETRVAILKKKAESLNIDLPDAVAHYIARTVQKNVRELQMALNRVYAHHSLARQPLTEELAAHILKNVLPQSRPLDIEQIQKEVSKYYKEVSVEDLKGPKRQKQIVRARQVAMFLARKLTSASFPEIGHRFNRDHSTVMSSVDKVETETQTDLVLKKEVDDLTNRLQR